MFFLQYDLAEQTSQLEHCDFTKSTAELQMKFMCSSPAKLFALVQMSGFP